MFTQFKKKYSSDDGFCRDDYFWDTCIYLSTMLGLDGLL